MMAARKRIINPKSSGEGTVGADSSVSREQAASDGHHPSKEYEGKAHEAPRGSSVTRRGPFSYLLILFNQLFGNLRFGKQPQAVHAGKLLAAHVLGGNRQEGKSNRETNGYQDALLEVFNTVNNLGINKLSLSFVQGLHKDLDFVIKGVASSPRVQDPDNRLIYSQLVAARKLLEIIIVLFEDVQGTDAVNRLVQRNQVFQNFKTTLLSVVRKWIGEQRPRSAVAFPELTKAWASSAEYTSNKWNSFRSRLAGDRTTKPPPPPPPAPEKTPPKEQEKGKADKRPRSSH